MSRILFTKNEARIIRLNSLVTLKLTVSDTGSVSLKCEYPTKERIEVAKRSVEPIRWKIYGPYYDQLHKEMNPEYPSPHG